jgi:hypothetical protein
MYSQVEAEKIKEALSKYLSNVSIDFCGEIIQLSFDFIDFDTLSKFQSKVFDSVIEALNTTGTKYSNITLSENFLEIS